MVQFKDEATILNVFGFGQIDKNNLTHEKFETLLKINPRYEEYFIITDGVEPEKKASSKTKSNKNEQSDSNA